MSALKNLESRLNAEFEAFHAKTEEFQVAAKQEYEARDKRFHQQYLPTVRHVVEVVKPRLEVLVAKFKDHIKVDPVIREHEREVRLTFNSPLASIVLTFRLGHDAEVKNLVFDENLEILPILMQFKDHARLTLPLDGIDDAKIIAWFDDCIVEFVQTLAALQRNQYYLKGHLVTDPIAGVEMPKYAAKSVFEADGKTYYFISEETKAEFVKQKSSK